MIPVYTKRTDDAHADSKKEEGVLFRYEKGRVGLVKLAQIGLGTNSSITSLWRNLGRCKRKLSRNQKFPLLQLLNGARSKSRKS